MRRISMSIVSALLGRTPALRHGAGHGLGPHSIQQFIYIARTSISTFSNLLQCNGVIGSVRMSTKTHVQAAAAPVSRMYPDEPRVPLHAAFWLVPLHLSCSSALGGWNRCNLHQHAIMAPACIATSPQCTWMLPCETSWSLLRQVGIGVVVLRKGEASGAAEVLLVQRAKPPEQGKWTVPGGSLELGETMVECAVREAYEETGLRLRNDPQAGDCIRHAGPSLAHLLRFLQCSKCHMSCCVTG